MPDVKVDRNKFCNAIFFLFKRSVLLVGLSPGDRVIWASCDKECLLGIVGGHSIAIVTYRAVITPIE